MGIVYEKDRKKWKAQFQRRGKSIFVGRYDSKPEAMRELDKARKFYDAPIYDEISTVDIPLLERLLSRIWPKKHRVK